MSSKNPNKIVGGVLAGLLALFAAVVVATPAWAANAAPGGNIYSGGTAAANVEAAFGAGNYELTGTTITLTKDASITLNAPIIFETGSWTLNMNGATITSTNESSWPGSGSVGNSMIQVAKGVTLAINGGGVATGTGAKALSALGVYGTCTVTNTKLSGGGVDAGSGTIMPAVAVSGTGSSLTLGEGTEVSANFSSTTGGGSAVAAQPGSSLVVDGASITTTGNKGAAVQVGATNGSASFTMKSGTLTANNGIIVPANGSVDLQGGTISLTGTGPAAEDNMNAIQIQAGTATEASVDINIGDVTVEAANPDATNVPNILFTTPSYQNLGSKASADVEISGGEFNGVFPSDLDKGNNVDMTVSGGTYKQAVDPAWLSGVGAMGVNKKGQVTYYETIDDVPSNEVGTPIASADSIQVTNAGIINSGVTSDTSISDALAALGVTSTATTEWSIPTSGPVLWVVWYGSNPTGATANFVNNTFSQSLTNSSAAVGGFHASGNVGVAWAKLGNGGITDAGAGTWTLQVSNGGAIQDSKDVPVATLTVYNAGTVSSLTGPLSPSTTTTQYYGVSNEPIEDVPAAPTEPTASDNSILTIGYYQLTQTSAPSASTTTYTAALWTGDEYVPSTPTPTILTAGYTAMPDEGVTAALSPFSSANVVAGTKATTTLTLTVGEDALGGDVALVTPASSKITNAPTLEADQAAITNGIASTLDSLLDAQAKQTGDTHFGSANWDSTLNLLWYNPAADAPAWATAGGNTWTSNEDGSVVSGATITNTITVVPSKWSAPYVVALGMDLTSLGVEEAGTAGEPGDIEITQPAAVMNVFTGPTVHTVGNGTVDQSTDASGNITLTANPATGATFKEWQVKYATGLPEIVTDGTLTFTQAQVKNVSSVTAVFEGGFEPVVPTGDIAVYRLYNTSTHAHLLTSSSYEVSVLTAGDWQLDGYDGNKAGIAFYALADGSEGIPVYRVYDPSTNSHLYTTSLHEVTVLVNRDGWHWDNNQQPIFMTPTTSSYKVYRLYNGNVPFVESHLWTASWNEFNTLQNLPGAQKWTPEPNESGVAWYATGLPTGPNA